MKHGLTKIIVFLLLTHSYFFDQAPYKDVESACQSVLSLSRYSQGGAIGTAEKEVFNITTLSS